MKTSTVNRTSIGAAILLAASAMALCLFLAYSNDRRTQKGEHPDENIASAAYSPTDDDIGEQNEIPLFDLFSDANMAKYLRENQP